MDDVMVLAFVGMPGVGKGTCTTYLNEKYGLPVIHFGNMVYEEVRRRGLDNVKDEVFVREDMRAKEGPAVLAKHVAQKAQEYIDNGQKKVVLDGLYSWSENKYLAEVFRDKLIVIAIASPKAVRHKRALERKDSHRQYTIDQLIKREIAEIENLEKGGPIANADYTLVNDAEPEKLLKNLDELLRQINFLS